MARSSALTELGPLTNLTHLEVSHVDDLEALTALLAIAPLERILVREISFDLLAQLPQHPQIYALIERGALTRESSASRRASLEQALKHRYREGTSVDVERLVTIGSAICGQAGDVTQLHTQGVTFKMVYCPSGRLTITRPKRKRIRRRPDLLAHSDCHLSRPFWIGQMPVTQALWEVMTGDRPSYFKGENRPVERVSWFDCVRFCNALSASLGFEPVYEIGEGDEPEVSADLTRRGFRLPTEAEWDYAALAGETSEDLEFDRIKEMAWSDDNAGDETRPVGLLSPNSWGLYDIFGNVSEWCSDELTSIAYLEPRGTLFDPHEWSEGLSSRSGRGGNWNKSLLYCSPANYQAFTTHTRGFDLGLRIARTI